MSQLAKVFGFLIPLVFAIGITVPIYPFSFLTPFFFVKGGGSGEIITSLSIFAAVIEILELIGLYFLLRYLFKNYTNFTLGLKRGIAPAIILILLYSFVIPYLLVGTFGGH